MWSLEALNVLEGALYGIGVLDDPLVVMEIGGRKPQLTEQGNEPFYSLKNRSVNVFEADPEEAERLQTSYDADGGIRILPYAVGGGNESRDFHVTKQRGSSSLYRPNTALLSRFNGLDGVSIEKSIVIETKTLDTICKEAGLQRIDLLKMDVQGAEGEVVDGGQASLAGVLAVVTEVNFLPMYEGQVTFAELQNKLHNLGLEPHHRLGCGSRATQKVATGREQELWADYLYLRPLDGLSDQALARMALIATLYDCYHVAVSALKRITTHDVEPIIAQYEGVLASVERNRESKLRRIVRILRYNHQYFD